MATVAALDRIIGRGSDVVAGLWSALAFLSAGWAPPGLIALSTGVVGPRGAGPAPALPGAPVAAGPPLVGRGPRLPGRRGAGGRGPGGRGPGRGPPPRPGPPPWRCR